MEKIIEAKLRYNRDKLNKFVKIGNKSAIHDYNIKCHLLEDLIESIENNKQQHVMKAGTKRKLLEAWKYCEYNDKSNEFMLEYMQDFAGVDLDCVLNFIQKKLIREG